MRALLLMPPGQIFGLDLDTSTWVAIAATAIALASIGVNFWNVSRTLRRSESNLRKTIEHSEEQASRRSYNEARDRVLGLFGRAFLAMSDIERELRELGYAKRGVASHAKELLFDLRAAQLAFAGYADPSDRIVDQLRDGIAAYHVVVDKVIANYESEFDVEDPEWEHYESARNDVHIVADRLLESSWRRG